MYNSLIKKISLIVAVILLAVSQSYSLSAIRNAWVWYGGEWVKATVCSIGGKTGESNGVITADPPWTIAFADGTFANGNSALEIYGVLGGPKPKENPEKEEKVANKANSTKSFSSYLVSVESDNRFNIKIVDVESNVEVLKENNINAFAEKPGNRINYSGLYIMKIDYEDEELEDEEVMFSVGEDSTISK